MNSANDGTREYRRQEMSFASGDVTLTGTLAVPEGDGPFPAVVLLQGSGQKDRDHGGYFPLIREHVLRHGLAVLSYDKPGTGGSTGDWRLESVNSLARHALTAVEWLQSQAEIAAGLVGLWGHSQGGWVALTAAATGDLSFIVAQSAAAMTPVAQIVYAMEHEMRRDGYDEREIARGISYANALLEAAHAGFSYARVEEEILQTARTEPWYVYEPVSNAGEWDSLLGMVEQGFDPLQVLERITGPILAVFGERDMLLPAGPSAAMFAGALARAGKQEATIEVIAGADHRIQMADGEFAPGYLDLVTSWILSRVSKTSADRNESR